MKSLIDGNQMFAREINDKMVDEFKDVNMKFISIRCWVTEVL